MTAVTSAAARRCAPWPKDALRIGFSWWWRIAEVRRPEAPAAATPAPQGTVPAGAVPPPAKPADDLPAGQTRTV
jgi:hypothetical protein